MELPTSNFCWLVKRILREVTVTWSIVILQRLSLGCGSVDPESHIDPIQAYVIWIQWRTDVLHHYFKLLVYFLVYSINRDAWCVILVVKTAIICQDLAAELDKIMETPGNFKHIYSNCLYWESFLRWSFLIWVLILLRTFVLILVVFVVFLTLFLIFVFLQDSAFLVAVNHLKTTRGEIWLKCREKNNKNYQDEDKSPQQN